MYVVTNKFADKEDDKRSYEVGDTYPREGLNPTQKRIRQLSSIHPVYKRDFIKKVEEQKEE